MKLNQNETQSRKQAPHIYKIKWHEQTGATCMASLRHIFSCFLKRREAGETDWMIEVFYVMCMNVYFLPRFLMSYRNLKGKFLSCRSFKSTMQVLQEYQSFLFPFRILICNDPTGFFRKGEAWKVWKIRFFKKSLQLVVIWPWKTSILCTCTRPVLLFYRHSNVIVLFMKFIFRMKFFV